MLRIIHILLLATLFWTFVPSDAVSAPRDMPDDLINPLELFARGEKIPLDSTALNDPALDETVIVGGDTVSIILPQKNYGRYDRGLFNYRTLSSSCTMSAWMLPCSLLDNNGLNL